MIMWSNSFVNICSLIICTNAMTDATVFVVNIAVAVSQLLVLSKLYT